MVLPGNGICVVQGEMTILVTAIKRGVKWQSRSSQEDDNLLKNLQDLKDILIKSSDLKLIEPDIFLSPFLDVIRSEDTTGPVTSLALAAVNKFLSYGIIDATHSSISHTVYNIADAITHARFIGTDQSSDGVVLMRILQVLRTLTLAPEGIHLTNESLCEIMLSCFRICFETRIHELLKKTAEHYLKDMVQLVFMRLSQFSEDPRSTETKEFKMKADVKQMKCRKRSRNSLRKKYTHIDKELFEENDSSNPRLRSHASLLQLAPMQYRSSGENVVDMQGQICQASKEDSLVAFSKEKKSQTDEQPNENINVNNNLQTSAESGNESRTLEETQDSDLLKRQTNDSSPIKFEVTLDDTDTRKKDSEDYVNERGIRFTPQLQDDSILFPYGLACVRELLRFLISLCNPNDKQNTDIMIHLGLTLLTVAFEVGADDIGKHATLLALVKDELCRNLFTLLSNERITIFAADLQVSFLLFESLRTHIKFQMEKYLTKLIEIIVADSPKVTYEHKEIALDNILQLWRIPGFVNELFLNYDCDMYCTNLFEDLTKLLSKNVSSALNGICHTHLLSLDALLTVIDGICIYFSKSKVTNKTLNKEKSLSTGSGSVPSSDATIWKNSRVKYAKNIPSLEKLLARKAIKRWLPQGTEHFNTKPKKGIQFFQEYGVLKSEFDPNEVAVFLRENPALDKKMIGEYISNRNNLNVLEAFVKTFHFSGLRIDEALRYFLETFRLPGEAPTISLILEQFAEYWHKSNGEPFADVDSAFTLAYAVIMLNVDQHNQNAKKQTTPMSNAAFKRNLQGVNGGGNFDEKMLDEIYASIKNEEIVMPSEHGGLIRENYLWKVLLRKGSSKEGEYYHIPPGTYNSELLRVVFGPIVSALCLIYEHSEDISINRYIMNGFEKCGLVSSYFGMTKNIDTLIQSLCKFTLFYKQRKQNNITVIFGSNQKAQMALKTVFHLVHHNGDCIREGWDHILDIIVSLYSNNLLPRSYIEPEDFIDPSGRVLLVYKETQNMQKQDPGLFSSLYSYMVSTENLSKTPSPEEQQYIDVAKECIKECNLDQLISDSKFLHEEALLELVRSLIELSKGPDVQKNSNCSFNENVTVFFLELLFRIVIQNRDRVMAVWEQVRNHIYTLVMDASFFDYQFLLERSVIGLLRVAIRLMRNEDMCPTVIQSLRMLLLLKSTTLTRVSKQISFGLYELLKTSAQNIHTSADWTIIFTLLECVGAGAQPPKPVADDSTIVVDQGTKSDSENQVSDDVEAMSDRGYTSDSELTKSPKYNHLRGSSPFVVSISSTSTACSPNAGGWILVGNEEENQSVFGRTLPPAQYNIALERHLIPHDPMSFVKCCESLAFLVRDVAHITPYNFDICVHCIRTFVEASLQEHKKSGRKHPNKKDSRELRIRKKMSTERKMEGKNIRNIDGSSPDESSTDDEFPSSYHHLLLDLMHTLHTRTAQIFRWWAEESGEIAQETSLWTQGWCPLLQGIARMCCDRREEVRLSAMAFLQRSLLVHDLQTLSGSEWEQCFRKVLFPLLNYLLQPINPKKPTAMAEFRNRAVTVLSKVFLHHLTPLLSLSTFPNIWLNILDYMDRYMHAEKSDILYEAVPELMKNMLLVMNSAKVFDASDGTDGKNHLWNLTWERIDKFLPGLKDELFKRIDKEPDGQKTLHQELSNPQSPNSMQQNVENATKSSIILQPPMSQQQVSSHLFAHLGQMVSTPIGSNYSPATSFEPPTVKNSADQPSLQPSNMLSTIMQPTLQTGIPYMSNLLAPGLSDASHHQHSFPVLYNTSAVIPSTSTAEVQPSSLYAEYIDNPYNIPNAGHTQRSEDCISENITKPSKATLTSELNIVTNKNNVNESLSYLSNQSGLQNAADGIVHSPVMGDLKIKSNYTTIEIAENFAPAGSDPFFESQKNVETKESNILEDSSAKLNI